MAEKNNDRLFFTCSLIEFMGRRLKRSREEITDILGKERLERIYEYADVFHCEPMEKVSETFIEETGAEMGGFDNVKKCRYTVPDYWDIGEVYEREAERAGRVSGRTTRGRIRQRYAPVRMERKRCGTGWLRIFFAVYFPNKPSIIDCKFAMSQYWLHPPR